MATVSCTRRIQFCAGHRVVGHESKCAHLHGHNYVAFLHAEAEALDSIGRVIDFAVLKGTIGHWIEEEWDHGLVLYVADPVIDQIRALPVWETGQQQKLFLLPTNPTAENMAAFLLETVGPEQLKGTGVRLRGVTLWETENCYAEVNLVW